MYLFENAGADVIVFEDMDRFNASRIFERLREVNTLVNVQRKKTRGEKYAPLRFFYLLRDDIFVSKGSDYFSLLKFLIRNGFIDETYPDYMTYFYEDGISANDKTFLRRITDKRGAEYAYALKEPLKVIASPVLRNVDFEQEETLNYDLLECLLLHNSSQYDMYLKTLIWQIRETRNFDFVSKFYNADKARAQFVSKLNEQ